MITNLTKTPKRPLTLMVAFNFNLSDLSANKAGNLSKRQIRIAEATQPNPLVQLILMGHVALIIGVMVLIVMASGVTAEKLLFLVGASMVVLSPFLYAMNRMNMMQHSGLSAEDLGSGEVLSVCGLVTPQPSTMLNQKHYITVDTMRFAVPEDALALFDPDQSYCIYYASHSKKIVSVSDA